jgi:hypothetical protein
MEVDFAAPAWLWQAALLAVLLGAAAWWLFGARLGGAARRRGAADALLLAGLNNAGKTCLLFRLCVLGLALACFRLHSPLLPLTRSRRVRLAVPAQAGRHVPGHSELDGSG